MTTIDVLNKIDDIINKTENKVNSIFEPSPILTATYREQGYLEIMSCLCNFENINNDKVKGIKKWR